MAEAIVTVRTEPVDWTLEVEKGAERVWINVKALDKNEAFALVRRQIGRNGGRVIRRRLGVDGVRSALGEAELAAYHARIARPLI